MSSIDLIGWDRLRHGGLLLDTPRLRQIADHVPEPLPAFYERELRRQASALFEGRLDVPSFATLVLEKICGFNAESGTWQRGTQVGSEWTRRAVTGEGIKPRQLWRGSKGGLLPVFFDSEKRIGIGRGRKAVSQVLQWLRVGDERLAMITNGRQWRLVFTGLDFDAWCEWDVDLWFEEGTLSPQVAALRTLLSPALWTPTEPDAPAPLLQGILDSRKGQAELSTVLGERVREAVELLVQAHGEVLKEKCAAVDPSDIYRAAVRVVMRMVIVLFAESRELLPCNNTLYHNAYGLTGLLETLEKVAARGTNRLSRSWNAWPRVLALFHLVHQGSHHQELAVPAYGGELFAPGNAEATDGLVKSLEVFENACFGRELMCDHDVLCMLELITRTRVKVRQGRSSIWMPAPVDFSDLSSEYIGILYEGLLDFELKTAPAGDPIVFLAIGNQPALPLSRLEAIDDKALADLLDKMKDTSIGNEEVKAGETEESPESDEAAEAEEADELEEALEDEAVEEKAAITEDERYTTRTRAEKWARRAVEVGKLAKKPLGKMTPEKRLVYEETVAVKARRLVTRVVLPGEWYLVRWGGTRKGAGTFYTRPGLAVPTVQRTLRPLAFDPPMDSEDKPDLDAPAGNWTPKRPEEILALKVCDPACGSGTFPVAALRFLTDVLFKALHHHNRLRGDPGRPLKEIMGIAPSGKTGDDIKEDHLPCRPEDDEFERRTKAVLLRYIVERCIYGVDLDPLAVELCRLSLWIETMDRELPFSFLDHKIKCGNSLVGAWFDQFQHYPVMAWKNREGGDKGHTSGVHFQKEGRTKAIKAWVKEVLTSDLEHAITGQLRIGEASWDSPEKVHNQALTLLERLHELPVQDTIERSRIWHDEFLGSEDWRSLKAAMDIWCACWFWPADDLDHAPLPTTFTASLAETIAVAERIAAAKRFFHWELEFPDVFRSEGSGFDAVLGNPPWDIAKPNSKEFFSNIDPLYRSYGKQEALRFQSGYFKDPEIEGSWLDYCADFKAQSNFMGYASSPFGDPNENEKSQDRFSIRRGKQNIVLHDRWRDKRTKSRGFADPRHPFRHQGSADINLYKLFLEQAHALLREGGRMGFIVPSGLYSDHGTGSLRRLFLDRCRWEWIFGFENRDGIFEIHRSYKFNPVVIEKGGKTDLIHTAFMRRKLEDWERAEALATPYSREQVDQFSPRSKAILEIQSQRDLEILEKIYANSVLLGDEGPNGWGIQYAREFDMTNDSKLFPPRPKWEDEGYRPDEYSRWIKGDWRPIEELWPELGVDPDRPVPISSEAEATIREADVILSDHHLRCAQPPYDRLPVPRTNIPMGIILSREVDAWIWEQQVEDVALPLYEGRMIGQFDFSQKGWVSGKGRGAVWREIPWDVKYVEPQYLMAKRTYLSSSQCPWYPKLSHMRVGSATNMRSAMACAVAGAPTGDTAAVFWMESWTFACSLAGLFNSFVFDYITRNRLVGLHLDYHVFAQNPLPKHWHSESSIDLHVNQPLLAPNVAMSLCWTEQLQFLNEASAWRKQWAVSTNERTRLRAVCDALAMALYGIDYQDTLHILFECDFPVGAASPNKNNPKGFWRVDKDKDPELRQTVLTLVAFHDLEEKIRACGGDREKGIDAFLNQNNGKGWMLPETLRLADYGLGHDERAKEYQPVASRLGPRFYDWQLAQSPEESWRECHIHARNLLGKKGYLNLLADVLRDTALGGWREALAFACELSTKDNLLIVFTTAIGQFPPDEWRDRLDEVRTILSERGFSLEAADMIQFLVKALRQAPEEVRPEGLSVARGLVGDAGHLQLLADFEAGDHGKVAEPAAQYDAPTGKMIQRRLFN